ncbi:MAG: YggT family protein [Aestuariivirga sp.]
MTLLTIVLFIFKILNYIILASVVMSWLIAFGIASTSNPNVRQTIMLLERFTEPLYAPIRRILPPMNGLDFSPMIALLLLWYVVEPVIISLFGGN